VSDQSVPVPAIHKHDYKLSPDQTDRPVGAPMRCWVECYCGKRTLAKFNTSLEVSEDA
jgi:hypothetical protein